MEQLELEQEQPQVDYRGKLRSLYQTHNTDPSLTILSDAKAADMKEILKDHGISNILDHLAHTDAQFLDVSEMSDYADVMREARKADMEFMKLPAEVRSLFDNDVANWLDAAHDVDKGARIYERVQGEGTPEVPAAPVEPVVPEVPAV